MRFFKTIKFRLTVWYLVAIMVLLSAFSSMAYFMLSRNLYQNLDDSLKTSVAELQRSIDIEQDHIAFSISVNELLLVYDANGTLVQRLGPNIGFTDIDGLVKRALFGQSAFQTAVAGDGQQVRLYAAPFTPDSSTRLALIVGRPPAEIQSILHTFRSILGFSALSIIALAGIGGLFLANRALRPVDRMAATAQEIGESDLSQRVDVQSENEMGRLATTLNGMIARLEAAFSRQRQFTADASHELRTPLAVIQAESTLALEKDRTPAEYRKSLELVSQEVTYMSAVIGKLLLLARGDSGKEPLNFQEVSIKELLTELSSDVEVLARDKGLKFKLGPLEDITVKGDRVKLRQLFLNLLENAIRYTASGGSIISAAVKRKDTAVVSVSDTGIGIPPEHLPRIFERFYRVDKARSRAEGGTGLGLAIVRYIVKAHSGKIEVESQPGRGSTFRVILPLSSACGAEG